MTVHIVQKGETLWKIAKQHQIPFDEIKRLNAHLANPDYIVPGMEIYLPDAATMNAERRKKEAPSQSPMPTPSPKQEMPIKEVPRPTRPPAPPQAPPQAAPSTQPPSWMPFPQSIPVPMPMPMPHQVQPIMMPQPPAPPQTIRIEQPSMQPIPIPMPMPMPPPAQPTPMQCPSCRMTVMIAMPQMAPPAQPQQQAPEKEEPKPVAPTEMGTQSKPCAPAPMPQMAPWMQPAMPLPWGGGHCQSCQRPMMPSYPSWPWPMQQSAMPMWPEASPMPMNESTSTLAGQPQVMGTQQWPQPDLKCEMQQHIVNQYYDEIREIEQAGRPCHPQLTPPMHTPYFQQ